MITSGLCRVRKPALGGGHRTRGTFNVASAGLCHPDVGDMTRHEKSRVSTPAVVPGATFSPRTVQFWGPDQMPCGPTRQAALPIDLRSRLSPPIASRCETEPASHIRQTGYRGDLISFGRSEGMAKAPRCYGLRDLPFRRVCWDGMASMAFHRSRREGRGMAGHYPLLHQSCPVPSELQPLPLGPRRHLHRPASRWVRRRGFWGQNASAFAKARVKPSVKDVIR